MIDTREEYRSILADPKLDELLSQAQSKVAAHIVDAQPAEVDSAVEQLQTKAAETCAALQNEISEAAKLRAEKVAIVLHMVKVASALSA